MLLVTNVICSSLVDGCNKQNSWGIDKAEYKYARKNAFSLSIEPNTLLVNGGGGGWWEAVFLGFYK